MASLTNPIALPPICATRLLWIDGYPLQAAEVLVLLTCQLKAKIEQEVAHG